MYSEEEQLPPKNGKEAASVDVVDDLVMSDDKKVVASTMTHPVKPVCQGNEKYYSVPFQSKKPCTFVKFPFDDQRRRICNQIMLKKIFNTLVSFVD